jgi:hypothetical protein
VVRSLAISGAFIAALVLSTGWPGAAQACAVCGCGDPTLTVMGDEKPFGGRIRAAAELRVGRIRVGEPGVDETVMTEERLELAVAYAPTRSTFLVLAAPLLYRQAAFHDGAHLRFFTIGDVELRIKQFVYSSRKGQIQHQVAIVGGLKAPSAPVENDDHGAPLPAALQPGLGSVAPSAGLFYGLGDGPWSFYTSATVYMPFAIRDSAHGSDSFRTSASVQRQVGRPFAARFGLDTRLDGGGVVNGQSDPNSGGFVAYLSPALVVSPATDLLLAVGAHVPFAQALRGYHHESTIGTLSVTYDF